MAAPNRPQNIARGSDDRPLIGSDNAEQGIGPTLGVDLGERRRSAFAPKPKKAPRFLKRPERPDASRPGERDPNGS